MTKSEAWAMWCRVVRYLWDRSEIDPLWYDDAWAFANDVVWNMHDDAFHGV